MSRETSPYIVGEYWLDQRRDGRAKGIWQIATASKRTIIYRSTREKGLEEAKAALDAHVAEQRAQSRQTGAEANVAALLVTYWKERGRKNINSDQTGRSIRTFLGFLLQDKVGIAAVADDLMPALFERFREWRMGSHSFSLEWFGEQFDYDSRGVSGATVQRNINDVRAAVYYAGDNGRLTSMPRIRDIDPRYKSEPRDRVLTIDELARIMWYASHNIDLFRFIALQLATAVRPDAAKQFDPRSQYDDATGLIDLQPREAPQTKKRNAVLPAIRPLRVILRHWAANPSPPVKSRKTAWRKMRKVLDLSADVHPKTIRHTIATELHNRGVPGGEISELLGHEGQMARTTRIYAKYDPRRLNNATAMLTTIWMEVSRGARAYCADHMLTIC